MLLFLETSFICFIMVLACIVGIGSGAEGMVFLYDKKVQERVIELGLTSKEKIGRNKKNFFLYAVLPCVFLALLMVYGINKSRGFTQGFIQLTIIFVGYGLFDRFFIDGYWVGHTKAWIIPGTEDLMPYIDKNAKTRKWISTLVAYPLICALISALINLLIK